MSQETGNVLLHGQLQDGLRYEIMKAPAVSGAQNYNELCLASQNEEKQLLELKKRLQYPQHSTSHFILHKELTHPMVLRGEGHVMHNHLRREMIVKAKSATSGHLQWNCKLKNRKPESTLPPRQPTDQGTMVNSDRGQAETPQHEDPHAFLLFWILRKKTVSLVRVHDEGSKSQTALVEIAGVPAYGIVDTGADITVMGPKLLKKVAMFAKLKNRQFNEPDKVPHTYDRRQFKLDGQLDLDVNFDDKMINTPIC